MEKRVFRFPICSMLLALLCVSISALADNIDVSSAQPEFDRALALSSSGFNNNSQLFSLPRPGVVEGRFISELCSFACEFQPVNERIFGNEISWLNRYRDGDYPDFGKFKRDTDFDWRKHPSTVPEPASLTLLGTSVLLVAFSLKKKLQQ